MTIPTTMKALQIVEPGLAVWADFATPKPGPNQVLVKVLGVTTCPQWDMHIFSGEPMFPGSPIEYPYQPGQPGHEAIGEIIVLGSAVNSQPNNENGKLDVGMKVACWRDQGHERPGCYAQFVIVEKDNLLKIPDSARPQAFAPLELAMCVRVSFQQLEKIGSLECKKIGVAGLGPAGLIAVQLARAGGAQEVVAIDPIESRRALALKLGADQAIEPGDDSALPRGRSAADKNALDMAVDCTGLKNSIEALMDCTRSAVAIFGVLREDISFSPNHWPGLALLGYGGHNIEAARQALELIENGKLNLEPLVTHTMGFDKYTQGVALLKNKEAIKICFTP